MNEVFSVMFPKPRVNVLIYIFKESANVMEIQLVTGLNNVLSRTFALVRNNAACRGCFKPHEMLKGKNKKQKKRKKK